VPSCSTVMDGPKSAYIQDINGGGATGHAGREGGVIRAELRTPGTASRFGPVKWRPGAIAPESGVIPPVAWARMKSPLGISPRPGPGPGPAEHSQRRAATLKRCSRADLTGVHDQ
jgi:hypothetical protein